MKRCVVITLFVGVLVSTGVVVQAQGLCKEACYQYCKSMNRGTTCTNECAPRPSCKKGGNQVRGKACYDFCDKNRTGVNKETCYADCRARD